MKRAGLSLTLVAIRAFSPFAALAATPAELAEDVVALVASGAGILMPDIDEPHVEDRGVLPLTDEFPAAFLNGLVPRLEPKKSSWPSYTYDAFGNTIASSGSMRYVFPHRFSTKYCDEATGLYYYGYRFYSPELGRWMNRDPIGESGGMNLYTMPVKPKRSRSTIFSRGTK